MITTHADSQAIHGPMESRLQASWPTARKKALPRFWILVAAIFLARLPVMIRVPLIGDEAYYWLWSRHLALGYHDHPPLVAWMVALFTRLSDGVFWVRLSAAACTLLSAYFFYQFALEILGSRGRAWQALIFSLSMPILAIASLAVFPDTYLTMAWCMALWAGWRSLRDGRYWLLFGLACGLGLLSKLVGLFLLVSLGFFFLISAGSRRCLRKKSFWWGMALCAAIAFPLFLWNARHGFENFVFQAHEHLGKHPAHPWISFLKYGGAQILSVSPFLFLLFIPAALDLVHKSWRGDLPSQFLLAFFLPIHLFFISLTPTARVGFHWAIPGYLSLCVAAARMKKLEGWKRLALFSSVGMMFFFYLVLAFPTAVPRAIVPLGHRYFPQLGVSVFFREKGFGEILGYKKLAEEARDRASTLGLAFLLTPSYSLSSDFAYYARKPSRTLLLTGQGGEFARWNSWENLRGESALWVDFEPLSKKPEVRAMLSRAFRALGETGPVVIQDGVVFRTFYATPLYALKEPSALQPSIPGVPPAASPTSWKETRRAVTD